MNSGMGEDQAFEAELIERMRGGDERAFGGLYSTYRGRLYSFLLRLSGHMMLAEELSQEVWLRLVTHPPAPQPGVPLGAWLFRVARNLYISYIRSRNMDALRISELAAIRTRPSALPGPWEELVGRETGRRLQAALMTLPLPYRESLLLVSVGGLTPHQSAEILGLPVPTFRKRLSRAREMLAQHMANPIKIPRRYKDVLR
jgi:RNA polymerase sigma-70 factor, ECF subfamily